MARVLVVEDDPDVAQLLARRLRGYGHDVLCAPSGRIAISLVGMDFPADVAVLDVNLPGMNGFEILEALRRHPELDNPQLPAVFLSSVSSTENIRRSKEMGAHYLTKPFISGALQGAILNAIDSQIELDDHKVEKQTRWKVWR